MKIGDRYGRWQVIGLVPGRGSPRKMKQWVQSRAIVRCTNDGHTRSVRRGNLVQGRSRSCGCLRRDEYQQAREGKL